MDAWPEKQDRFGEAFASLERDLRSGAISPYDFLDTVLELDQADPSRKSSLTAVTILSQPRIIELLDTQATRIKFYSIRSLSYFHKAQIRISEGDVDVEDDLANALHDSEEIGPQSADWSTYIRATMAYLRNDLEELKRCATTIELNRSLVENFISGLEERGEPDYLVDYAKERRSDD